MKHSFYQILIAFILCSGQLSAQVMSDTVQLFSGFSITGTIQDVDYRTLYVLQKGYSSVSPIALKNVNAVIKEGEFSNNLISHEGNIYQFGQRVRNRYADQLFLAYPDLYHEFSKGTAMRKAGSIIIGTGIGASAIAFLSGVRSTVSFSLVSGGTSEKAEYNDKAATVGLLIIGVSVATGATLMIVGSKKQKATISKYNHKILFPDKSTLPGKDYSLSFTGTGIIMIF